MYKKKEPTALEGVGDGFKAIGTGIVAGATGLFVQPAMGAKEDGVKGMVVGVGQGVMGAVVLPVAGLLGGIRRMGTGIKNGIVGPSESSAEEAPEDGQTEFDRKLEKRYLEDRQALLTHLQPFKAIMNAPGLDEVAPVDIHLYMALSLPPTAAPRDITFAYVKLSRKYHPDHEDGKDSTPDLSRFQDVSTAFQVLSDARLRRLYNKGEAPTEEVMEGRALYTMMMGGEPFSHLVDGSTLARVWREPHGAEVPLKELVALQAKREANLVRQLESRLRGWAEDSSTKKAFQATAKSEVDQLSSLPFGREMCHLIGAIYEHAVNELWGGVVPVLGVHPRGPLRLAGSLLGFSHLEEGERLSSTKQQMLGVDAFKMGRVWENSLRSGKAKRRDANLVERTHEMLARLWEISFADYVSTLREVCMRVLLDKKKTKLELDTLAAGLHKLGQIFKAA